MLVLTGEQSVNAQIGPVSTAGTGQGYFVEVTGLSAGWNRVGLDDASWPSSLKVLDYGRGDAAATPSQTQGNHLGIQLRGAVNTAAPVLSGTLSFTDGYGDGLVALDTELTGQTKAKGLAGEVRRRASSYSGERAL